MGEKRLNKAISETGYCSRRGADKLIEQGSVKINGVVAHLGDKVVETDEISVDGQAITKKKGNIYLIFNKPRGITCTTDTNIRGNIITYMDYPERIFPIGRLDKPSEGLIFMTNDGDIVNKILRSGNQHQKEYIVKVDKKITPEFIRKMSNGVPVLDTVSRRCEVTKINDITFKIILTQGLNRQIRRMCNYLGYNVIRLKRVRIMNVSLGKLEIGKYRNFTKQEFEELSRLLETSSKTEEASI